MKKNKLLPIIVFVLITFFSCSKEKIDMHKKFVLDNWHIQSSKFTNTGGEQISSNEFNIQNWYTSKVPETVLHSLVKNEVYKDIYRDNNLEKISADQFFVFLFATPRSPRWLIANNIVNEARIVLEKCGTDSGDIEKEIIDIQKSLTSDKQKKREPLFVKKYKKPILLAIAIAAFNQLSGINAILYYAPHIFTMAGFEKGSALLSSMGVGGVMFIFTIAAMAVMDSMGRKKIMIIGSIGYIISLGSIAWAFLTNNPENFSEQGSTIVLIGLLVFVAAHGFGQGSVIWVYLSEIFPNKVRGRGQSLGTSIHWILAATTSWTFPFLTEISGGYTFVVFTFFMVLQLIWVLTVMPETKGISLEEMEKKLGIVS
jgi:hypothetical protein